MHKIRNIALPSTPDNNYLLLSIDGVIHKYDISTKEMIFSFKASAYRAMQIHDNDSKILTCDSSIVKIWEFEDDNADLLTSLPSEDKIEKFYASSRGGDEQYYVGVFQDLAGFKVYKKKLDEFWYCRDKIKVTSLDFTIDSDAILAGDNKGNLHICEIKNKNNLGAKKIGRGDTISFVQVLNYKYAWVATEEPAVYVCPLDNNSKDPYKLETNPSKIKCLKTCHDQKHIVIGFEDSTIEFWKFKEKTDSFEILKEIKEDFVNFDIDSLWSSMLILNPKGRDIEYHIIEWEWDTSKIDEDLQKINLDFENLKESDIVDSPVKKQKGADKPKKRNQTACWQIF